MTVLILVLGGAAGGCISGAKIVAIGVGVLGEDPFFAEGFGDDRDAVAPADTGGSLPGDTAGLYGGSLREKTCDKAKLVTFLTDPRNARKAQVWAEIRGIRAGDIPGYVKRLTPVLLRTDTLVRNHGFRNGAKIVFEALLEAGISVLADEQGQPVVKCNCGNPLAAPERSPGDVSADIIPDPDWRLRFTPRKVIVVKPGKTRRIRRFHLIDIAGGKGIGRPAGTDSGKDVKLAAPPALPAPPAETSPDDAAPPAIAGTWESSSSGSLIRVDITGGDSFTGVLARDLEISPTCLLREGRTIWTMRGTGSRYTGSVTAVDLARCGDLEPVSASRRLEGENDLTMCLRLDQEVCETLRRT